MGQSKDANGLRLRDLPCRVHEIQRTKDTIFEHNPV